MKIVAIIPAYNEEESIAGVVKGTKKYVDKVLVINDGSTDSTEKAARRAGAMVYSHPINRGLGPTILDGYREALKMGADIILQTDADGQYLTTETPKLLKPVIENQADMSLGSRFAGEIESMPGIKKFGNRMFSRFTSFLAGTKITDAQTGFRAMRRELLENIIPTGRYTYTQEMIIRTSREGYRIIEVPIYFAKREHGESRLISNSFSYGSNALSIMVKTFREYHPLKFFGVPGILFILLGILLGLSLVNVYVSTGTFSGYTASIVLTALLIISGGLLIFMGMLADMMEAKYRQTREHFRRGAFAS
jgi:glycosyltransferase involved in cell wall biosynthesis